MNKKPKYFLIGTLLSIAFFIVMGTPTALIPNPFIPYVRMVPPTFLDYFFLATTSVLLAALISLKLYLKSKESKSDYKALAGGVAGFFAFSCPVCNVLLVAALGFATILAFIEPWRPVMGVLSIALLSYLIYREARYFPKPPAKKKLYN